MASPHMIIAVVAVCLLLTACVAAQNGAIVYRVYVGSYTDKDIRGITLLDFNSAGGDISVQRPACETASPSFLAVHPNRKYVYATNEFSNAVSSFRIEADGMLTQLSGQSSGGAGPCHLATDVAGKCLMAANYNSGSFQIFPLTDDGSVGKPVADAIQHTGAGTDPKRQASPHAHGIYPDPTGKFALAVDLGTDQIAVYALDSSAAALSHSPVTVGRTAPGAGPRHLAFSPDGRFAYVTSEMNSTVTVFRWEPAKPSLTPIQAISTLPAEFAGKSATAEIAVHPSGRTLYVSNRGHDSIAIFTVDPQTGRLALRGHQNAGGKNPRHFVIDPTGRWMLVSNQTTGNVVVLAISTTGDLGATGKEAPVKSAVCAVLVPR